MCDECDPGVSESDLMDRLKEALDQRDAFREVLEQIKAKLSVTDVPEDQWVRDLHGEIFALAHYALNPE